MKILKVSGEANFVQLWRNRVFTCTPGNGFCEQYGLSCGMWVTTGSDGSITTACLKCL